MIGVADLLAADPQSLEQMTTAVGPALAAAVLIIVQLLRGKF